MYHVGMMKFITNQAVPFSGLVYIIGQDIFTSYIIHYITPLWDLLPIIYEVLLPVSGLLLRGNIVFPTLVLPAFL